MTTARVASLTARLLPVAAVFWALAWLTAQPAPPLASLSYISGVDGAAQSYSVSLPRPFRADVRYPLIVVLHGEQVTPAIGLLQFFGLRPSSSGPMAARMSGAQLSPSASIVVCPLARGTMGYQGIAERDVYDVLADVKSRYPIDEDRVYLAGNSMGGGGALWLALSRPDVWAAAAAVSPVAPPGTEDLVPNALNLPIRIYHGEQDPVAPRETSRRWQKLLMNAGAEVEYIEFPGVRGNAWELAYRGSGLEEWFAGYRRRPMPDRVRFATRGYRYNSAYWLRIDGLTPGALSEIDARRVSASETSVETRGVDAFSLVLPPALAPPSTVAIDGSKLRLKPGAALSFARIDGRWRSGAARPEGKRKGAEGPMSAVADARQVYVYGTADRPGPEELANRRSIAQRAADWSTLRARVFFSPPVKADSEVTPEEADAAALILFGTRQTNLLIARFAPQLPLALQPGAADYGLAFIAPVGGRYILVSSGLPWWTGAEEAGRGSAGVGPWQLRLLDTFGDFILFKGSLAHVVSEGRFDRNWRLPPDASAAMLAAGTVIIQP